MTKFKVGDRVRGSNGSTAVVKVVDSQGNVDVLWDSVVKSYPDYVFEPTFSLPSEEFTLIDELEPTFMDAYYWLCDCSELYLAEQLLDAFGKLPKTTVEMTRSEIQNLVDGNTAGADLHDKLTAALDTI